MSRRSLERTAIVLIPVVALAVVAVGIHVGASRRTLAARVYAWTPGVGRPGLPLQVETVVEEGGGAEAVGVAGLRAVATLAGRHADWRGASNSEGVAEVWLDVGQTRGETVELSLTAEDGATLAAGQFRVGPADPSEPAEVSLPVRRMSGKLRVDLSLFGGTLVPGSPTVVAAHVRDAASGRGVDGITLAAEPEGLAVDRPFEATKHGGWSTARVTATFLAATWTLTATSSDDPPCVGTWYGALPVSPGGAIVDLPLRIEALTPQVVSMSVPPATPRVYVSVVDAAGLDFGAALDIDRARAGTAEVVLPPLAPGDYWLITSSDAHGAATSVTGTTVARPFRVGPRPGLDGHTGPDAPDDEAAELAQLSPRHASRRLALDGFVEPHLRADRDRRRGLSIAAGALAIAMVLEALLILRAARRAEAYLDAFEDAAERADVPSLERRGARLGAAFRVVVLVLLTLLGFAVVALLLQGRR